MQIDGNEAGRYNGGATFTYTMLNFKPGAKFIITIIGKAQRLDGVAKTISNKAEVSVKNVGTVESNVININIEEDPYKQEETPIYNSDKTNNNNNNNNSNNNNSNNNNSGTSNNNRYPINNNNNNNNNSNSNNNNSNSNNNNSSNNNNNSTPNVNQAPKETHSITGLVWLDANKNNRKDDEEKGISGLEVELHQGRNVVKTTTTNGSGIYQFTGIEAGDYTVNFKYDGEKYISATYKGADIEEDLAVYRAFGFQHQAR